jgi:hypothetical protein
VKPSTRAHVCQVCERDDRELRLVTCPICHARVCLEHSHSLSGKRFCSKACAQLFFFGDTEDGPDPGDF